MKSSINIMMGILFLLSSLDVNAQYDCNSATIITSLPYNSGAQTTSVGASFNVSGYCGVLVGYNERSYIFKYTPVVDEALSLTLNFNGSSNNRAGIYMYNDCGEPPSQCVKFGESTAQNEISFNLVVQASTDYYIFIGSEDPSLEFVFEMESEVVEGVAINKVQATQVLDVNGAIRIGEGSTTPYEGTMQWNALQGRFEGYNGSAWIPITSPGINDLVDGINVPNNLALGTDAGVNLNNGKNTIVGNFAGQTSNTGFHNCFFGHRSGSDNTGGNNNTFLGFKTGDKNTDGYRNVYIGSLAGQNLDGNFNTLIGMQAGYSQTSGEYNVFLGAEAGMDKIAGSGNIYIGAGAKGEPFGSNRLWIQNDNADTPLIYGEFENKRVFINRKYPLTQEEVFGITADVADSGEPFGGMYVHTQGSSGARPFYGWAINNNSNVAFMYLDGNTGNVVLHGANFGAGIDPGQAGIAIHNDLATKTSAGSWTGNSDRRLKKNIQSLNSRTILEKVLAMRGVSYEWNDDKTEYTRPEGLQMGFIAQDLQKIWPEKVTADQLGYLQTAYGDYDPVFVEAIKALNDKIEAQEKTINILLKKMTEMEKIMSIGTVDKSIVSKLSD